MTWTNTGGGDHEGADWTPDGDTVAGVHYGIGTFSVSNGQTATISAGTPLEVYANIVSIVGTIDGNSKGYQGSNSAGAGPGGGGRGSYNSGWGGGGGAGYGGAGGNGSRGNPGIGHAAVGIISDVTSIMGSAGGGAANNGIGGDGGGLIKIYSPSITITGTITLNGGLGTYTDSGPGAGGSGGGLLFVGNNITVSGILSADGGNGKRYSSTSDGSGGGGGGRIKICYFTSYDSSGSTITVAKGVAVVANPGDGVDGTINTMKMSQCTLSIVQGQTFTIGADSALMIDKVTLWVTSVNTSGDFVLKIWDSTSKNIEYGSKTVTISSTGSTDFQFSNWIRLPDGESTYYIELTTAGAGDIELGVYGISSYGDFYRNDYEVARFDLYHQVYSIDHSKGAVVYNTGDSGVKANISNIMLIGAEYQVNADDSGSVTYVDDFTTNKYLADYSVIANVTYDSGDNELDIADDGYIAYSVDCKYSVDGIPTLTAQINITAGIPTIQISTDGATWYDIDDAIIDNSLIEYDLISTGNLVLDGNTSFYFRIDCVKGVTATCSIKSFQLDVVTDTTAAQNPYIFYDTINTFKCDQDAESGINCTIELISEESILQPIIIF